MHKGNWIPLNKKLAEYLPTGKRPYTELEAAFCVTCDYDNGKLASISGYAKLWLWGRKRVAKFAEQMGWHLTTSRSKKLSLIVLDDEKTGMVIHGPSRIKSGTSSVPCSGQALDKLWTSSGQARDKTNNGVEETYNTDGTRSGQDRDKIGTSSGQARDKLRLTTSYPNPNPNNYLTATGRKLQGKRLDTFETFWEIFNYKTGKAAAADAWMDIPSLTDKDFALICSAAKSEADQRANLMESGLNPIMATAWISGRRWEDEKYEKITGSVNSSAENEHFYCVECASAAQHGGNCNPLESKNTTACNDLVHLSDDVQKQRSGYGVVNSGGVIVPLDLLPALKAWRRENKDLWIKT